MRREQMVVTYLVKAEGVGTGTRECLSHLGRGVSSNGSFRLPWSKGRGRDVGSTRYGGGARNSYSLTRYKLTTKKVETSKLLEFAV